MNILPIVAIVSFGVTAMSAHQLMIAEPERREQWRMARFVATVIAVVVTALFVWRSA